MDRPQQSRLLPGLVTRGQDAPSKGSMTRFGENAEESPVSEYSTPKGSPTGRNSPRYPMDIAPSKYERGPQPSRPPRPPRPNEVMPLQAAKLRNYHLPMRKPPEPEQHLIKSWNGDSKVLPGTIRRQKSNDGVSESVHNIAPPSGAPRKAQLVPPVAARRGGSSLYSQPASFTPILEETADTGSRARNSVASSRVVPSSWGSHPEDYNFDRLKETVEEKEEERRAISPTSPDSMVSYHDDTAELVRQASMGKKMKPSLTKISSSSEKARAKKKEKVAMGTIIAGPAAGGVGANQGKILSPTVRSSPSVETVGNRTLIIDSSSSSSQPSSPDSGKRSLNKTELTERSRSPLASPLDRSARQPSPLSGINRDSPKGPSMSDKVPSNRRPPQLNMEAVRDAEARGSITSLPDLIKRATRLAANLDRGKTASRTGLRDMASAEKMDERRRSGSISDILASFPPPSRGTPDGTRPTSRWPSPFSPSKMNQRMSYLTSHDSGSTRVPRNYRRCCGMRLWIFVVIVVLLAVLIAAAIVVPIVLIVLPRQRQAAANDIGPSSLTHCADSTPCDNGGVSVVSGDMCRCICVHGFTGARCSTVTDPGCTVLDIDTGSSRIKQATLGNAIPRIFDEASSNYSIPINSTAVLGLFSTNNLSCTSENALIAFDAPGVEARNVGQKPVAEFATPCTPSAVHSATAAPRTSSLARLEQRQIGTSNGIVFQMSSTAAANPDSTSPSSSTISSQASASSAASSGPSSRSHTPETMDFARVAILYVLGDTGQLNTAVKAQEDIKHILLGENNRADTISVTSELGNMTLNLSTFSITLGNGTTVGGKGDGIGGIMKGEQR